MQWFRRAIVTDGRIQPFASVAGTRTLFYDAPALIKPISWVSDVAMGHEAQHVQGIEP